MYRFTSTIMIFAMGFGFHSSHAAAPPDYLPSRVVQFADLDLSRTEGAAVLYHRLQNAAETVCGQRNSLEPFVNRGLNMCVQTAISTAVAKVNRPALTEYYKARLSGHNSTIQIAQNHPR
jgi:UrcA family protein